MVGGRQLTTHIYLVLRFRLRMSGYINPHTQAFMACTGQTLPPSYKKASIFEDKWLPCHFISGRSRGLLQGEDRDTENFRDFKVF